ncbi:DUF805 domain-containing protein [Aliiroseovarius sp. KMU-50]|uniref:DUF805 domain-containing protein n=1 Tax=Aliiroseovarius salicola TaxID=3009082 RepID=A0ABT4VWB0_9RHOB|nr:DUF805 domain-containing protein [Aliiroseovarius sp. KMU-50]MDA5092531.1 DUF805 domain-containing protein [Aliiroseovarius sp. KMU-50]
MNFQTAIKTCFSKYVTFQGRAARSEFWWFALFVWGGQIILSMVDSVVFGTVTTMEGGFEAQTNMPILSGLFALATFLPAISVAVRRLHDKDRTGWWYWIVLVPVLGFLLLLFWFVTEGTRGANRYGPDPLGGDEGGDAGYDYAPSSIPRVDN